MRRARARRAAPAAPGRRRRRSCAAATRRTARCPARRKRLEQQPRDPPVARRDRMVGRLQRRVEGDAHARGSAPIHSAARASSASAGEPEPRRQPVDAALHVEVAAHARLAGRGRAARGAPGRGSAPRAPRRAPAGRRAAPARRSRRPRSARRSPAAAVATQARPWLCASISTFGRPSRSPSRGDLGGEHEQIGLAIGGEHLRLRPRAAPFDAARRCPSRVACALQPLASAPPPIWTKRQCQIGRQQRQRVEQIVIALLLHRAADRQDDAPGRAGSLPSRAPRRARGGGGKRSRSSP